MKMLLTTLSLGVDYTREYTLRLIEDTLALTDLDIYIQLTAGMLLGKDLAKI